MHKNRHNMGNFWPVAKKGNKYVAASSHNNSNSVPLSVVMRDVLKMVRTTRELKKALNEKQIKISGKEIRDANYPVGLFDVVSAGGQDFRVLLGENKKFKLEEAKEADKKVVKIIGKKNLGKKGIQFNLMDGRNVLSKEGANVGDSVIVSLKDGKIVKIIKMEKGNRGFVIHGKHSGVSGKIVDIVEQGGKHIAVIDDEGHKEKINVWVRNVIVM
tara:strand:- start:60 stop:704 length:645 start_codon:yes stop_codon:yes gene_type:complete